LTVAIQFYFRHDRQTAITAKTAICRFNDSLIPSKFKTTNGGLGGLAVLAVMMETELATNNRQIVMVQDLHIN